TKEAPNFKSQTSQAAKNPQPRFVQNEKAATLKRRQPPCREYGVRVDGLEFPWRLEFRAWCLFGVWSLDFEACCSSLIPLRMSRNLRYSSRRPVASLQDLLF